MPRKNTPAGDHVRQYVVVGVACSRDYTERRAGAIRPGRVAAATERGFRAAFRAPPSAEPLPRSGHVRFDASVELE